MQHIVRTRIGSPVIVLLILLAVQSRVFAQDPLEAKPPIYRMVFENDRVRMLEVTFQPGDSISVHTHPDHAVYAVTECTVAIYEVGAKPMEVAMKAGEGAFLKAQSHSAKNTGKTTAKLLVVELKDPAMMKKDMKEEMKDQMKKEMKK